MNMAHRYHVMMVRAQSNNDWGTMRLYYHEMMFYLRDKCK